MKIPGRTLGAVALIALLGGPASAQTAVPQYGETDKDKTPGEIAAEKETERSYRRSLGNIPEQKSSDPWGTVRSDGAPPKAAAKDSAAKNAAAKNAAAKAPAAKPKAKSTDVRTDGAAK